MLRTTLILLALAAFICQAAPSFDDAVDELYNNVVVGDYEHAVEMTKDLEKNSKGDLISKVVDKLIQNSQRNTMEYAYNLWSFEAKDIIKKRFPIQFRIIFGEKSVVLINKRDNLALKLGTAVDSDGDRTAYGDSNDKTSDRVSWKFFALSEDKKVYFKIMNVKNQQFLKLGGATDSDGEHKAYASSGGDYFRQQWYLQPVSYDGDLLFYIFNREYNHALKLGRAIDDMDDRQVYGHSGNVIGNPEHFGWYIKPF